MPAAILRFRTPAFDLSQEPAHPITPLRGASLLAWLHTQMPAAATMSEAAPQDSGWYTMVHMDGRDYLVGASAEASPDGNHHWWLRVEKQRSLKEKLLGEAGMSDADPCLAWVVDRVTRSQGVSNLVLERGR